MGSSVSKFSADRVASQVGKVFIVTGEAERVDPAETALADRDPPRAALAGSNVGIGFAAAKVLTQKGATVIVASRDARKVAAAVRELGPNARGEVVDLASFASIDAFAARVRAAYPRVDVLINNAGVFLPPHVKTPEGFEVTLGVNTIGTARLTNLLLPLIAASPEGRIVSLSSSMGESSQSLVYERALRLSKIPYPLACS